MIKNYFFLSRIGNELNSRISGCTILENYTIKKDTLFITLRNENEFTLEICVNHSMPFILLNESFVRKKRNSVNIFSDILNLRISAIFIAKDDRVLLFQIENEISLFFSIRGKFTNVYLLKDGEFSSFKKLSDEELEKVKNDFLSLEFVNPLTLPDFSDDKNLSIYELKKKYPFISNEIIDKVTENEIPNFKYLIALIENIFYDDFYLIKNFEKRTVEINYVIHNDVNHYEIEKYSSALEISSDYLKTLQYYDEFNRMYKYTQKTIEKDLTNLISKKNNIINKLKSGNNEEGYKRLAELLLINKNKLATGLEEIFINNVFNNNTPIRIQLNRKFTPQQNIEYYFNKAKEERIFFARSDKILSQIENRINVLENASKDLTQCKSLKDLQLIMKNIGIKMKQETSTQNEPKMKFRHYKIENRFNVFVGKDSKSNDLLTLKFAKQNDYWFHARSVSGSHVVLKIENKNESVPKNILKKVASIAAFYSKAKSSSLVSVSFTQKKYVIKKKGMDIGQVALIKENTLLVKPEIPEDTVLVEQE